VRRLTVGLSPTAASFPTTRLAPARRRSKIPLASRSGEGHQCINISPIECKEAESWDILGLLCVRRDRPRRRAAEQRDEGATSHLPPMGHLLPKMPVEEACDFFECLPGLRRVHVTIVLRVRLPFKDLQYRFDTGLP
jgi:hypothetical protein